MTDLDLKFEFVHFRDTNDLDIDVRLEISAVILIPDEVLHLRSEQLDISKGGSKVRSDRHLLAHSVGASDILDPDGVENNVGNLGDAVV